MLDRRAMLSLITGLALAVAIPCMAAQKRIATGNIFGIQIGEPISLSPAELQ